MYNWRQHGCRSSVCKLQSRIGVFWRSVCRQQKTTVSRKQQKKKKKKAASRGVEKKTNLEALSRYMYSHINICGFFFLMKTLKAKNEWETEGEAMCSARFSCATVSSARRNTCTKKKKKRRGRRVKEQSLCERG